MATVQTQPRRQDITNQRIRRIQEASIDFIPNAGFESPVEAQDPLVTETLSNSAADRAPADLPAHLRQICEVALLSREQEVALFREMNYSKHQASVLRDELDSATPDEDLLVAIESHLARAQRIRDHIIKANMRLVMSIVKKFVSPQLSFDDMLSDGICALMGAVEKFDFDRGFRFSTYAYRSIARNAYRTVTTAHAHEARFTRDAEDWAFEQEADQAGSVSSEQVWSNLRQLAGALLDRLDRRERFIVRSRYALGAHRKVRTFQCLADKLGVSKERVRQIEQRAVGKLRAMASEMDADELFGAALA